jgi:UPF0755 protein
MTIRGGGRPRDQRSQAHPIEPEPARPDASVARSQVRSTTGRAGARAADGATRRGANSAHHGHGLLRFGLFAAVLVVLVAIMSATVLRPLAAAAIASWAIEAPSTWQLPFIGSIVEEALADELATKASDDPSTLVWTVESGDTVESVSERLVDDDLVLSRRAFEYAALDAQLADRLEAGNFRLRHDMTPPEVVQALIEDRVVITTTDVTFREGLRLEQMTALLQTIDSQVDPAEFYRLVTEPPPSLLEEYPWLELEPGQTLEGYLYPATYTLRTDDEAPTDAEGLVRMLLDTFIDRVGSERLEVPASRGLTFTEILTLASIVEKEAALDEERALIAGVYQNRVDDRTVLGADPTVIYGADGAKLDETPFESWFDFFFGQLPDGPLAQVELPERWAPYNSYAVAGLPPGPIASPTVASIDAALEPDTEDGFLYFVLIPDSREHDFSKSFEEHTQKLRDYGYL